MQKLFTMKQNREKEEKKNTLNRQTLVNDSGKPKYIYEMTD